NKTFFLYSHAPIGMSTVAALAKEFGVPYSENNITDMASLAKIIDAINEKFSIWMNEQNFNEKIKVITSQLGHDSEAAPLDRPFARTLWSRMKEGIDKKA